MKAKVEIKFVTINGFNANDFNGNENVEKSVNKLLSRFATELEIYFKKQKIKSHITFQLEHG